MKSLLLFRLSVVLIAVLLPSVTGCSSTRNAFLPPHPNSDYREDVKVTVKMLSYHEMKKRFTDDLKKPSTGEEDAQFIRENLQYLEDHKNLYLPPPPPNRMGEAEASMLAAFLLKESVDFIQYQLEEEAKAYTATFSQQKTFDSFYRVVKNEPFFNYAGLEITRSTRGWSGRETPGSKLVCLLKIADDASVIFVEPVYFQVAKAKVKVLSYSGWRFWSYLYLWTLEPNHYLDVKVSLSMTAYWLEKQKESGVFVNKSAELPATTIVIRSYDLDRTPEWRSALREYASGGLIPIPPRSSDSIRTKPSENRGPFRLAVTVTEQDPSNAQANITAGAAIIEKRKAAWLELGKALIFNAED